MPRVPSQHQGVDGSASLAFALPTLDRDLLLPDTVRRPTTADTAEKLPGLLIRSAPC
jgi:hypothetical protein